MYRLIVHSGPLTIADVKCDRMELLRNIAHNVICPLAVLSPTCEYYTDENAIGEWTGINPSTGEATGKSILKGRDRCCV
jgi:hypothetical protein